MNYEQENIRTAQAERQYVGARLGAIAPPDAALTRLTAHLREQTSRINDMAHMLHNHADRVHGECPSNGYGTAETQPCRSGALGDLEDALDQLERSCTFLNSAANRNCNLA